MWKVPFIDHCDFAYGLLAEWAFASPRQFWLSTNFRCLAHNRSQRHHNHACLHYMHSLLLIVFKRHSINIQAWRFKDFFGISLILSYHVHRKMMNTVLLIVVNNTCNCRSSCALCNFQHLPLLFSISASFLFSLSSSVKFSDGVKIANLKSSRLPATNLIHSANLPYVFNRSIKSITRVFYRLGR